MHSRAANMYRRVDLDSAPLPQVLERLFDRFLQDLVVARDAIAASDIQTKANAINHAMRIVAELTAALDHPAAPELCANLEALYGFVIDRLTECNTTLSLEALDQANKLMADLGATFRQAHASR